YKKPGLEDIKERDSVANYQCAMIFFLLSYFRYIDGDGFLVHLLKHLLILNSENYFQKL
ncbi:hypothetical protein ACJX0J_025217, partial [Zea mays]